MKILIDADGCPVVDITAALAAAENIECIIICDDSHIFDRVGAVCKTVSKGADSADFAIVNAAESGDIIITQDYGLAALGLAKNATVLNQDGMEYTSDNIDALLMSRHTSKKLRNAGVRLKGQPKRTAAQNESFKAALSALIEKIKTVS